MGPPKILVLKLRSGTDRPPAFMAARLVLSYSLRDRISLGRGTRHVAVYSPTHVKILQHASELGSYYHGSSDALRRCRLGLRTARLLRHIVAAGCAAGQPALHIRRRVA